MKKTCPLTGEEFVISEEETNFLKKMNLKLPIYSPKTRSAMRLAFRNERNLYMRKCDSSGERILSVYNEDQPFPVYKYEYWIGDEWTPPSLDYDPGRDFFEQYDELQKQVPRVNLFAIYNENCDYVNAAEKNKNCYMHIISDRSEDCYYTYNLYASKDCVDSAYLFDSELCYECTDGRKLYHCVMCFLCDNSSNLFFCFDMRGCSDCFFSYGLRNQKYCIFNKQYSKEEYEEKMKDIKLTSFAQFAALKKRFVDEIVSGKPYVRMINVQNSDGNFLQNCRNCHKCYDVEEAEDCYYLRIGANGLKDVYDTHSVVDGSELIYNCVSVTESYNCHNIIGSWTTKNNFYSQFLQGCEDCIGCVSLRRKKNCILNKQYSKEEYEKIKADIIAKLGEHYGSPLPISMAPFTYQDSAFRDHDSMTREEVEKIGWVYGEQVEVPAGDYKSVDEIPDDISSLSTNELNEVYMCPVSKKPFKIIPQEIKLLQRIGAPLPRKHHDVRFEERVRFRKKRTNEPRTPSHLAKLSQKKISGCQKKSCSQQ